MSELFDVEVIALISEHLLRVKPADIETVFNKYVGGDRHVVQQPDGGYSFVEIKQAAISLGAALREKGFMPTAVGVAVHPTSSKLIVYAPRVKDIQKYIAEKCLGQWQTYEVVVKRMGKLKVG